MNAAQKLALALRQAKRRQVKPVRKDDQAPGTGTNEAGPRVETNYPPNAWPEDGDHA